MTFEGGGFRMAADDVGGTAFLHSLEGNGDREALGRFLGAVSTSLSDCTVFTAVEKPAHAKFYKRIGFQQTGQEIGGIPVMVRFPQSELN